MGGRPGSGTAPSQVHESGSSLLIAHAEDGGMLGAGPDGVPVSRCWTRRPCSASRCPTESTPTAR